MPSEVVGGSILSVCSSIAVIAGTAIVVVLALLLIVAAIGEMFE